MILNDLACLPSAPSFAFAKLVLIGTSRNAFYGSFADAKLQANRKPD